MGQACCSEAAVSGVGLRTHRSRGAAAGGPHPHVAFHQGQPPPANIVLGYPATHPGAHYAQVTAQGWPHAPCMMQHTMLHNACLLDVNCPTNCHGMQHPVRGGLCASAQCYAHGRRTDATEVRTCRMVSSIWWATLPRWRDGLTSQLSAIMTLCAPTTTMSQCTVSANIEACNQCFCALVPALGRL